MAAPIASPPAQTQLAGSNVTPATVQKPSPTSTPTKSSPTATPATTASTSAQDQSAGSNLPADASPQPGPTASLPTMPAPTDTPPPTATPVPTPTPPDSPYKDGTYKGSVADAYYGYVQVEVTIKQGKITDVQFLEYPNHARTSRFINSQAMPWLTEEALQAQSAQVDIIFGASATSEAFQVSLASALRRAAA